MNYIRLALTLFWLMLSPAVFAVFNHLSPVFRYTDQGNGQVLTEIGTIYLDGHFEASSLPVEGPASDFAPDVLAAISGKIVATESTYIGFKSIINRKFKRSAKTYWIAGGPWVIMSVSGVNPYKPVISVSAIDDTATEQDSKSAKYQITLDAATTVNTNVKFSLTGSAKKGKDYVSFSNQLKIPAGRVSGDIEIKPVDDAIQEITEVVKLSLKSAQTYKLSPDKSARTAQVQILDND